MNWIVHRIKYVYDGIELFINGPAEPTNYSYPYTVIGVSIIDKNTVTSKGLKLGDPMSKVTQLYGESSKRWKDPDSVVYENSKSMEEAGATGV